MRLLYCLRLAGGVVERVVLALEGGARLREELGQHLDRLAEPARALADGVEGDAVGLALAFEPAGADAEDEAAVAHVVDGDGRLGEQRGETVDVVGHQKAVAYV